MSACPLTHCLPAARWHVCAPAGCRARRARAAVSCAASASDDLLRALFGSASLGVQLQDGAAAVLQWVVRAVTPLPPSFPPGPPGDCALELAADPLLFLERVSRRWPSGVVGLRLGGAPVVLVSSPQLAEHVLLSAADAFQKRGTAFFPGSALVGEGLLVSDGDVWRRQRRLSAPAFRAAAVASYAREMGAAAASLTQPGGAWGGLAAGRTLLRDVYEDFNDLTLRIVSRALFGADWGGAEAEINAAIRDAFRFFARRAGLPEWLPSPDGVLFAAAVRRLDRAVYALISARRRAHTPANGAGDLLDALMAGADGEGMTDIALRDELMTLLVAGQETSGIVLAWSAALLAQQPAAAARCAAEARAVLGTRAPAAEDYGRLHACAAVALEAMRLRPPAYLVGRCAKREVAVPASRHRIPADCTVLVSPYLLHRSAAAWPAPAEFDPFGRWLDADGTCRTREALSGMGPGGSYIPFGAGPRNCIGAGFAMMEVVLVLAAICRDIELALPPSGAKPVPAALITLRPDAVRLRLSPRRMK